MPTPEQIGITTKRTIEGVPIRQIAAEIGASHQTVIRIQHDPAIKAKIEAAAAKLINGPLNDAVETISRLAKQGKDTTDKDWAKLGLDASKHITGMAGLSGTTPSTVINALIQVNEAPQQGQELTALTAFLQDRWGTTERNGTINQSNTTEQMHELTGIPSSHTQLPDGQDVIDVDVNP